MEKCESIKKEILRVEPFPSGQAAYAILRRKDARSTVLETENTGTQGCDSSMAEPGDSPQSTPTEQRQNRWRMEQAARGAQIETNLFLLREEEAHP